MANKMMPVRAIEFTTRIDEDGQVQVPIAFQHLYGKHGRVIVLIPEKGEVSKKRRTPGSAKGKLTVQNEDDEHLDDFKEYMP